MEREREREQCHCVCARRESQAKQRVKTRPSTSLNPPFIVNYFTTRNALKSYNKPNYLIIVFDILINDLIWSNWWVKKLCKSFFGLFLGFGYSYTQSLWYTLNNICTSTTGRHKSNFKTTLHDGELSGHKRVAQRDYQGVNCTTDIPKHNITHVTDRCQSHVVGISTTLGRENLFFAIFLNHYKSCVRA